MKIIYIFGIMVFLVSMGVLTKFTYKEFKEKIGERIWKFWDGRTTYWSLLIVISGFITFFLMLGFRNIFLS